MSSAPRYVEGRPARAGASRPLAGSGRCSGRSRGRPSPRAQPAEQELESSRHATQGRQGARHRLRLRGRRRRPEALPSPCSQRGSPAVSTREQQETHRLSLRPAAGQASWMRVFLSYPKAREHESKNSSDSPSEAIPRGGPRARPQSPWSPWQLQTDPRKRWEMGGVCLQVTS